jgi:hypothetical protein
VSPKLFFRKGCIPRVNEDIRIDKESIAHRGCRGWGRKRRRSGW